MRNLEHALEITAEPAERASLLERAATSAQAAAMPSASDLARQAVDAWKGIGERGSVARSTALLADILMDVGDVATAGALLAEEVEAIEAGVPAGEVGEPEALLFAMRSRALMRIDQNDAAVAEADRALRIAETRNYDLVAAMALVNKGSAFAQLGRRYESQGLLGTGIRLANRGGWSHLELRALRNLANSLVDDEPIRALETTLDAIETARRLGDHQAFASLVVVYADFAVPAGAGEYWDRAIDLMAEASELPAAAGERMGMAAARIDRRILRGEDVTDALEDLERLTEEDPDPHSAQLPAVLRAAVALVSGHPDEAAAIARGVMERDIMLSGYAAQALVTGSILTADLDTLRWTETAMEEVPFHGASSQAYREHLTAARQALDGRTSDAVAGFTRSLDTLAKLGARLTWARGVLDALLALPGEPRFLALAPEARAVFEGIDAAPFIALLDDAVTRVAAPASEAPVVSSPSGTPAPAS